MFPISSAGIWYDVYESHDKNKFCFLSDLWQYI